MNTVEHIVECYYRICHDCFTMTDVKVIGGNNRQFDLLAVNLLSGEQFHVESSVSHSWGWPRHADELLREFDHKVFGVPAKAKGKSYRNQIIAMYGKVGMSAEKINRVYCTWVYPGIAGLTERIADYSHTQDVRPIKVISFRDEVLPQLEASVTTANYEDEVLRTLSLLRQQKGQVHGNT